MTQPLPSNIFLCGFMGTGKSTVGPMVAHELGFKFIDSDEVVKNLAHKSVQRIFKDEGEAGFRVWEKAAVKLITQQTKQVVALGGGALLVEENRIEVLNHGLLVHLQATAESLVPRLANNTRPLLAHLEGPELLAKVIEMMKAREPVYQLAALKIDTSNRVPADVARELISEVAAWKP